MEQSGFLGTERGDLMKKCLILLALFFSCNALAYECIKPKYTREALRQLLLRQEFQNLSELEIRNKLPKKEAKELSDAIWWSIYICKSKTGKNSMYYDDACPEEKRNWTDSEFRKNGSKIILELSERKLITAKEFVYLDKFLNYEIEDSNCDDY
jgi:hypothetical protein